MHHFNEAIQHVAPYLHRYGYLAIFVAVFLEGIGIPAPGVTLVVAAALAAGRGAMNLPLIFVTAVCAALLGFNSGYWLGVAAGEGILRRLPFFNQSRFLKFRRLFTRWGTVLVVVAPFIDGVRQLNGYAAGIAEMPWLRFASFNLLGSVAWIAVWCGLAYEASIHAGALYTTLRVGNVWWYIAAAFLLLVLLSFLLWHRRRNRSRTE
ncbi:MAG: DedA family protein [Bryobacteraceae bacterium]